MNVSISYKYLNTPYIYIYVTIVLRKIYIFAKLTKQVRIQKRTTP